MCVARHAQRKFAISLQYLKENLKDEINSLPANKYHRFLQIDSYCHFRCVCVTRLAQITQNNKFAISLQYRKKKLSDEFDFLHADKHGILPQIDTMILMGMSKHFQSS